MNSGGVSEGSERQIKHIVPGRQWRIRCTLSQPVSDYEASDSERPFHRGVWVFVGENDEKRTAKKDGRHTHARSEHPTLFSRE